MNIMTKDELIIDYITMFVYTLLFIVGAFLLTKFLIFISQNEEYSNEKYIPTKYEKYLPFLHIPPGCENNKEIEFKLNRNFFTVLILSLIFIVLEIAGFIYTWITYKWR